MGKAEQPSMTTHGPKSCDTSNSTIYLSSPGNGGNRQPLTNEQEIAVVEDQMGSIHKELLGDSQKGLHNSSVMNSDSWSELNRSKSRGSFFISNLLNGRPETCENSDNLPIGNSTT
ncbi:hypothetical protein CSKR_201696, partial [Clonorchis sinensis]